MNTYQQAQTGTRILELSDFFSRLPFGRWLRNQFLKKALPLSRTLDIRVIQLLPGHCITRLNECTRLQNEHYCLHESAISALAEHAARLAMLTGLHDHSSASLTGWTIQYQKAGHGLLTAECRAPLPQAMITREFSQLVVVRDESDAIVARASSQWLIRYEGEHSRLES